MAKAETNDPFAYMMELCHISSSQEEILRHCPFAGQTVNLPDDEASPSPGGIPVASTGIAMTTLTAETPQDSGKDSGPQDVFHTPPEQSSLPTSQLSEYAEAAEFVDLSDDWELGFAQVKLKQRVDRELAAECSRGIEGAGVSDFSNSEFDQYGFSKRELSSKDGLGESPLKKVKNSEQNPGFDSSQACFEIEPQNVLIGKEMPVEKNLGSCENLGSHVTESEIEKSARKINLHDNEECVEDSESREGICEAEKLPCSDKGNKSVNEIAGVKQPERCVLPSSIRECLENEAKEIENGKGNGFVFDVLKALKENSEEDSLENVSWLQLAEARGFNFPRPCWRTENDNEKN